VSTWSDVERLLARAPGDYSVCVLDGERETLFTYAADAVRPAASLIKVPLAMALVTSDQARLRGETGVNLEATAILRDEDRVEGVGSFDSAPAGTRRTLWQLIGHALRESDNTAANLLIDAIGMQAVNHFLRRALGLPVTCLQRRFMDFAAAARGQENLTSAREMCMLFHALLARDGRYDRLVEWLTATPYDDKIVAGVPAGTVVAHKVGDLPGVEHDAGIVYAPERLYVVALLSGDLPDAGTGKATLAEASRLIYQLLAG